MVLFPFHGVERDARQQALDLHLCRAASKMNQMKRFQLM